MRIRVEAMSGSREIMGETTRLIEGCLLIENGGACVAIFAPGTWLNAVAEGDDDAFEEGKVEESDLGQYPRNGEGGASTKAGRRSGDADRQSTQEEG